MHKRKSQRHVNAENARWRAAEVRAEAERAAGKGEREVSDRELIQAAAKAAAIPLQWPRDPATHAFVDGIPPRRTDTWQNWNPLANDGDCARLEAALLLHVEWWPAAESVHVGTAEIGCTKPWGADRQAARRAAAVHAAAALGGAL